MDLNLDAAPVLITGAASGIGRACAEAFAAEGARLGLIDQDSVGLEQVAGRLRAGGSACATHSADVTNETQVSSAVGHVAQQLGGLQVVVACAGISGPFGQDPEQVSAADFNHVLQVNVTGTFLLIKHALADLRRAQHPAIVVLGSDSGFVAAPGMLPYNAAKGALVQFVRALSVDLAPDIRVNAVCPSIVDTPMSRTDLGLTKSGFTGADYPVQTPEEVAAHVLYLSSIRSRPVNGAALVSDFGYLARSSFPA